MKKILIGTSAIVAAAAFAAPAQAADPIKLSIGGFGSAFVTWYDNEDSALGTDEVTDVVVDGDNEFHLKGSTTLDNGLTVSIKYEMEAGGAGSVKGANFTDEWALSVAGSFGTIIMGAEDAATEAVAVVSPHMGGRLLGAGASEGAMINGDYVQNTGKADVQNATFINSGDQEQISYVSPSFAGFTFGATYIPDLTEPEDFYGARVVPFGAPGTTDTDGTNDTYGVAAMYNGEFSGLGVKVSTGWATVEGVIDDQWQAGLGLSYAGFEFGGAYSGKNGDKDSRAWETGVGYKTGPYGIALAYFDSEVDDGVAGDDEARMVQLTTQYEMGPGVLLVGGLGWAEFDNGGETNTAVDDNEGWVVQTGLNLAF